MHVGIILNKSLPLLSTSGLLPLPQVEMWNTNVEPFLLLAEEIEREDEQADDILDKAFSYLKVVCSAFLNNCAF